MADQEIRDLNRASGVALMVGLYSLSMGLAIGLTPPAGWGPASFVGLMTRELTIWPPIIGHLVLAFALFGAVWRESRLLPALILTTCVFLFWAFGPLVAARVGALPYPSPLGLATWIWFAGFSLYGAWMVYRIGQQNGTHGESVEAPSDA